MKPKLSFLIILPFLFLFSGSVYGQEEVKKEYWDNGNLKSEVPYNGIGTSYYETGEKRAEFHLENGKEKEGGMRTGWYKPIKKR